MCLFVCLGAMGCNPIQFMGPLDPRSVAWESVDKVVFTLFRPIEQKLVNLEWFLSWKINYKFKTTFSELIFFGKSFFK